MPDKVSTRAARLLEIRRELEKERESLAKGDDNFIGPWIDDIEWLLAELTAAEAERDTSIREEKHYHALYVKRLADYEAATAQLTAAREALRQLHDWFAYGQREHQGMMVVATPRCSPSAWKEIKRITEAALGASAVPQEKP